MIIKQDAPVGPKGAKFTNPIQNGGWNVVRLVLKTLKGQPYQIFDDGYTIKIYW